MTYHYLKLDAMVDNVSLSTASNVCLDEGEIKACAEVSIDDGDSSLGWSDSQWTHRVSPECKLSLLRLWKTVHRKAENSLDICGVFRVYGAHVGKGKTSDSRNSTAC